MESILDSVKKLLGIDPAETVFDDELIIHINSVFSILFQLGVGPQNAGFMIFDNTKVWNEFIGSVDTIQMVKSFMYLKVRLLFDPPANSFVVTSFETQAKELEWRLNVQADPTKPLYNHDIDGSSVGPTPGPSASYPNLISPYATLVESDDLLMESGSTRGATITIVFNRGYIDPPYGTNGKRAGEALLYSLNGVDSSENTFDVVIDENNASFYGTVSYAEGEQPKDSLGNDYDKALPAGTVSSPALIYEFVNPIYSNAAENSVIAKEPLISRSVKSREFTFAPQTVQFPETFDIPADWDITAIEVLNEVTERYEDDMDEFDVSDVIHQNVAGVDLAYKRYTDNRGYAAGERKVKVSWI